MHKRVDVHPMHLCNIHPSPGDFPRGRPAHSSLPRDFVRRLRGVVEDEAPLQCSAKGCRATAVYQLRWLNPQLHSDDVRKTWLACEEHRNWLSDFLRARGFLREVGRLPSASGGADALTF